jgi:general secretion pathway protein G
MPSRRDEPRVFFPWERRRGFGSVLRRARARQVFALLSGVAAFTFLRQVELRTSAIRQTRAVITTTENAVAAWRADHDRACPASLAELVAAGYVTDLPRDAWHHPLRMACPGRKDPRGFDVSSDGPDGLPGGLDRVE